MSRGLGSPVQVMVFDHQVKSGSRGRGRSPFTTIQVECGAERYEQLFADRSRRGGGSGWEDGMRADNRALMSSRATRITNGLP